MSGIEYTFFFLSRKEKEIVQKENLKIVWSQKHDSWYVYSNKLDSYHDTGKGLDATEKDIRILIENGEHLDGMWVRGDVEI